MLRKSVTLHENEVSFLLASQSYHAKVHLRGPLVDELGGSILHFDEGLDHCLCLFCVSPRSHKVAVEAGE